MREMVCYDEMMEEESGLRRMAEEIAIEHSYIESDIPESPELTGDPLFDTVSQFGLNKVEINDCAYLLGVNANKMCEELVKIAENLGGGLSVGGKRQWLITRLGDGMTLDEILADSESLKDSPAT